MSDAATPTVADAPALDDRDVEPRTPMKRLGSTRKLAAFNTIRLQLGEQTRVLEARAEATSGVAAELHDYCRRRADLEHDYARALDKLARAAAQRDKDHRHKREQWPLTGAHACWQAALEATRSLARDHAALAELYGGALAARLQRAADDALRLHRKCRDIVAERHEDVAAALAEAAAAGKHHAAAAADWRAAALKLRHAYDAHARLAAGDPPRHKKLKALEKDLDKRRGRHDEARARALRARADYVLSLEAANATLQRYYLDDIADVVLCMEVGFEGVVGRAVRAAGEAEGARGAAAAGAGGALCAAAAALDALADRQRLLQAHAQAFALPRPLPHQGAAPQAQDEEMRALAGEAAGEAEGDERPEGGRAGPDAALRLAQLEASARQLRAEAQENAKTLDAAEAELVRQMEGEAAQWDVSGVFGAAGSGAAGALALGAALGATPGAEPRRDLEDYYLAKFRSYVSCAGRLARLESKARALRRLAGAGGAQGGPPSPPPSPPRRAAARLRAGQFAAPLDHRLPRVLTSCVRVIAAYGLRHQGVFRVSGSQVEMQALRAAFERGEDPLEHVRDASDINSVCGLLKLYLREVRPPLLPPQLQERLLRIAALPDDGEFVRRLGDTLAALALPAVLVLRYLFAFLAHLAEHSEHNMMDAWNLAICLGPTLLAAWGEGGAQVTAQNLVNELVKRTILHHARVFPQHVAPYALYTRPPPEGAPADASDACDACDEADASDARDDLSLYDDDDEDDDNDDNDDNDDGDSSDSEPAARPPQEAAGARADCGGEAEGARLAESTPDLVLDLPARAAAEHFAHNHDTLRKRPAPRSPVPARNTARVAAQFAELTLTGGSLKPALAAKPALLRRPTPHPQHARAPPAADPPAPAAAPRPPAEAPRPPRADPAPPGDAR